MPRNRIVGVVVVVAVVVVAFVAGLALFGGSSEATCDDDVGRDFSYAVTVENAADLVEGKQNVVLLVTRDTKPVAGADVCVTTRMSDGMTAKGKANELAAGRYRTELNFGMEGSWDGSVVIKETGRNPAAVPLHLSPKPKL
jgi:hypothetical protein